MQLGFIGMLIIWTTITVKGNTLIPSKLAGQFERETYRVATLIVGTPGKHMNLIIDPTSSLLLTKIPMQSFSASVKPTVAGNTDVVHIQSKKFRVLIGRDYGQSMLLGCPTCDGVLGVSPGSRLWLREPYATFTAGSIALGTEILAFQRAQQNTRIGKIECLPFYNNICAAKATVEGFENVTVIFGTNRTTTLVPVELYDKYTNGKTIAVQNTVEEWGDIHFKFESIPNTGHSNHWVLNNHCIVAPSAKKDLDLLLEGSSEYVIELSRASMRCMMIKRFYLEGTAQVIDWSVQEHASTFGLVLIILLSILLSYWTLDPMGAWSLNFKNDQWKVLAEGLTIVLAIATLCIPNVWNALWEIPEMWAYAFFTIIMLISWQVVGAIVYAFQGKDLFGQTRLLQRITADEAQHFASKLSQNSKYPIHIISDPMTWTRGPFMHSVVLGVAHPRIWVVQAISRHSVILLSILFLLFETRVETYGSLGATGAVVFLFFGLVYYGVVGLGIHMGRRHITFAWVLFWVFYIYLFLTSIIILDTYVVRPFMLRFTNVSANFNLFLRVAMYTLVGLGGIALAIKRIQLEEIVREMIIRQNKHL